MRLANRVVTAFLSLFFFCVSVLTIVEVIYAAFDRDPFLVPHDRWYRTLTDSTWDSPAVRWVFIFILMVGLLLLWMQVQRRSTVALRLKSDGSLRANLMRVAFAHSLERFVYDADGVDRVRVKVSPKKVKVKVHSAVADRAGLAAALEERVRRRLAEIPFESVPATYVSVRKAPGE